MNLTSTEPPAGSRRDDIAVVQSFGLMGSDVLKSENNDGSCKEFFVVVVWLVVLTAHIKSYIFVDYVYQNRTYLLTMYI